MSGFISFSINIIIFNHFVAFISGPFLLIIQQLLFFFLIYLSVDEYLGYFQVFMIMNKTAINSHHFSWESNCGRIPGSHDKFMFHFLRNCFPKWSYYLAFLRQSVTAPFAQNSSQFFTLSNLFKL